MKKLILLFKTMNIFKKLGIQTIAHQKSLWLKDEEIIINRAGDAAGSHYLLLKKNKQVLLLNAATGKLELKDQE